MIRRAVGLAGGANRIGARRVAPRRFIGSAAARPGLTAKASVSAIKAWQQFRVYGASKNIKAGTRVTLQQLQHKRWVSLPISMNTNRNATYDLRVKLGIKGIKGLNSLRIVGGGAISNIVKVTIR